MREKKKRTWNVLVVGEKEEVIIRSYTKKKEAVIRQKRKRNKKQPRLPLFFFDLLCKVARRAGVSSTLGCVVLP